MRLDQHPKSVDLADPADPSRPRTHSLYIYFRFGAHAIVRVVYKMLKYKVEYEQVRVEAYEQKYKAAQIKYMQKRAAKLGFQLIPA